MRAVLLHAVVCTVAFAVPRLPSDSPGAETSFPGWPSELEGAPLKPVRMEPAEEAMVRRFPGRMAKFTDGRRQILLRYVERDTRRLHPPSECLRALGHQIRPLPTMVDAEGRLWGVFEASRDGDRLLVRERIYEAAGKASWTDVSSWYWAATLRRTTGPWWSVTVAEPLLP